MTQSLQFQLNRQNTTQHTKQCIPHRILEHSCNKTNTAPKKLNKVCKGLGSCLRIRYITVL